jgi:hemin uptake protein HemP
MTEPKPSSVGKPLSQPPIKVIDLKELMGSAREVQLYHQGSVYLLRLTKANKLILTK